MAGRIKAEDIATVKERSSIEDVVREHVTLRPAGPGSLKGLCPFHDEKTPSLQHPPDRRRLALLRLRRGRRRHLVRPEGRAPHLHRGRRAARRRSSAWSCATRRAARPRERGVARAGARGSIEAHRVAAGVLHRRCCSNAARGRGPAATSCASAASTARPPSGSASGSPRAAARSSSRHLRAKGFTDDELVTGGLVRARGSRGLYDRFRGRLVWPIRDITGDTVGFGARRLFDDDRIAAKYLNTSETPIYKKSTVLYGLDLAKKAISAERQAVVVEGYTDVMACHLAGVEGAVATCGTAFGVDHIKILRRIMRDEADLAPARVIFTFDGDAAGQKAAMRAFAEDQRGPRSPSSPSPTDGMDPCELRRPRATPPCARSSRTPCRCSSSRCAPRSRRFDLDDRRGAGPGACGPSRPIVGSIRDQSLRPEYTRDGVRAGSASRSSRSRPRCARAGRMAARDARRRRPARRDRPTPTTCREPAPAEAARALPVPDLRDPVVFAERQLLQALLQYPGSSRAEAVDVLAPDAFSAPAHRAVFDGIRIARPHRTSARRPRPGSAAVAEAAPLAVRGLVSRARGRHAADPDGPRDRAADRALRRRALRPGAHDRQLDPADRRRDGDDAPRCDHAAETRRPSAPASSACSCRTLQRELATLKAGMG